MPSIEILGLRSQAYSNQRYGGDDRLRQDCEYRECLETVFASLDIKDAATTFIDSDVINKVGQSQPYAKISGSIDMSKDEMRLVGNHFLPFIDVELYSPDSPGKAFRERGSYFEEKCFEKS